MFGRRIMLWLVITIILLIVGLPSTVVLLKEPICQGKLLKSLRSHVEIYCPPKDLFSPTLDSPINLSKNESFYTFNFTNKYSGCYFFCILLDKLPGKSLELQMDIEFFKDEKLLFSKKIETDHSSFKGRGGDGFILFEFFSPKEVPIEENITGKLRVLSLAEWFNRESKSVRLYIQRKSEK